MDVPELSPVRPEAWLKLVMRMHAALFSYNAFHGVVIIRSDKASLLWAIQRVVLFIASNVIRFGKRSTSRTNGTWTGNNSLSRAFSHSTRPVRCKCILPCEMRIAAFQSQLWVFERRECFQNGNYVLHHTRLMFCRQFRPSMSTHRFQSCIHRILTMLLSRLPSGFCF